VTLGAAVPINSALIVRGERADVQPSPDDPRYWTTSLEAHDGTGRMVAAAAITFVAVRGAARKLAAWVAPPNSPDVLRRIFPAYA
jgi:hypothetical protein